VRLKPAKGILKHCSRPHAEMLEAREPGGVGRRFLEGSQPSLEAQLCNLADEIAYNAHDIDDGVRSGLITLEQVEAVPLFVRFRDETLAEFPHARAPTLV
jgi:dGTPase